MTTGQSSAIDDVRVLREIPAPEVSRRHLLGLAAGLTALATKKGAANPPDFSAEVDSSSLHNKLVRRITMGCNQAEVAFANEVGFESYLEYQIQYQNQDDTLLNLRLANPLEFATLNMTYEQMLAVSHHLPALHCSNAALLRGIYSKRQLYERMVEVWTDHFNIEMVGELQNRYRPIDERDVIRPNAMTSFSALLNASAKSPAMLNYLNNDISTQNRPNENYARELMELHTLGSGGGYTQQDVAEVARCFTGWTIHPNDAGPLAGRFRFDPAKHDPGSKTVLGYTIAARPAAQGISDGEYVLFMLLNHPSTAHRIAAKLCHRFLGHDTPQGIIDKVATVYTQTGGSVNAMLRACITPNHLASAGPKYKRPWHLFVTALRVLPTAITSLDMIQGRISSAGNSRYLWATPEGYPDTVDYWAGFILSHWNLGCELFANEISGVLVDTATTFLGVTTNQQVVDRVNNIVCQGEMTPAEKARILLYLQTPLPPAGLRLEALGLAVGCPTFQWY